MQYDRYQSIVVKQIATYGIDVTFTRRSTADNEYNPLEGCYETPITVEEHHTKAVLVSPTSKGIRGSNVKGADAALLLGGDIDFVVDESSIAEFNNALWRVISVKRVDLSETPMVYKVFLVRR